MPYTEFPTTVSSKPRKADYRWWEADDEKLPGVLMEALGRCAERDSDRRAKVLRNIRMYGNSEVMGLGPQEYSRLRSQERVTLNVVKATADTVVSKTTRIRPVPKYLTTGGVRSLARKAKLLERWTGMQFYLSKVHSKGPQMVLDSCVTGTGVLKPVRRGQKIEVERVLMTNLYVDSADAIYGSPQIMYEVAWVNRDKLLAMQEQWGYSAEARRAIENASTDGEFYKPFRDSSLQWDASADQILVMEAWRLPPGPGMAGSHAIVVDGGLLHRTDWDKQYFPHVLLPWTEPMMGLWGNSLAEELLGIQVQINRYLQLIEKAHHLMAKPVWWVDTGTLQLLKRTSFTNEIGTMYPYAGGQPPKKDASPVVPAEIFAHLSWLYSRAYEIAGISQANVGGTRPLGVDSGEGLRVMNEIQSERFGAFIGRYEGVFMQLAERMVDLAKEIDESTEGGYKVVLERDRNTVSRIDWKQVDMEKDAYILQVFPASALPSDPGGRLSKVTEMINTQLVDLKTGRRLLNYPDTAMEDDLESAATDNLDRVFEAILDDGKYFEPEPYWDLQLALKRGQMALNKAQADEVPESRLQLMRRFLRSVHLLMAQAMVQQQVQTAMPGEAIPGLPPGPGGAGAPPTAVQ